MYSVLLVDDEPFVRIGLRDLIEWRRFGFEIAGEAENGAEALDWVTAHMPDLVLSDIRMPLASGLELARQCAEHCGVSVSAEIFRQRHDARRCEGINGNPQLVRIGCGFEAFV